MQFLPPKSILSTILCLRKNGGSISKRIPVKAAIILLLLMSIGFLMRGLANMTPSVHEKVMIHSNFDQVGSDHFALIRPTTPIHTLDYFFDGTQEDHFWIRCTDGWHGFFAQFLVVLNSIRYAERKRYIPYVFIGEETDRHGKNPYFQESVGSNIWDYYFRPISPLVPPDGEHAEVFVHDHHLSWEQDRKLHNSPEAIKAYYYGEEADGNGTIIKNKKRFQKNLYDDTFYWRQRSLAHRVVKDFIRVKNSVLEIADDFIEAKLSGGKVLGVHMRGTDKIASGGGGPIIPASTYAEYVQRFTKRHPRGWVFVATESQELLQNLKDHLPVESRARIVSRDGVLRSNSTFKRKDKVLEQNIFLDSSVDRGFQKGLDVLVDVLLLSSCDFLIHGASSVSEAAIWFNLALHNNSIHLQYEVSSRQRLSWSV
mmetsp:Transcript_7618/g.11535  ORF Transcript_7618/g.11535 Transcript_7618/m.11535 type:complete len:426 (-) Transcript_7618:96-1373(-)